MIKVEIIQIGLSCHYLNALTTADFWGVLQNIKKNNLTKSYMLKYEDVYMCVINDIAKR